MKKSTQPYNGKAINLDFLLDSSEDKQKSNQDGRAEPLSLDRISNFRHQKRYYYDPKKLNDLKVSIEQNGLNDPVLVRPHPEQDGNYELIYGHRRVAASRLAGKTVIDAKIRNLNDEEALALHLDENLNRHDLNSLEETEAILELLAHKLKCSVDETVALLRRMQNEARGKVTQNVLSNHQGKLIDSFFNSYKGRMSWESFVTSRLPLLKLPSEILEVLRQGKVEYTKAIAISKIKDDVERKALLAAAIDNQMSLSKIKHAVREINSQQEQTSIKPVNIEKRVTSVFQQFKRSKAWEDPSKKKRIDRILTQLEKLI